MSEPWRYHGARILVFAKAPVPGAVKTRLIPALGAEGAAALYRRLLEDRVATLAATGLAPPVLCCAPDGSHPVFQRLATRFGLELRVQVGGELGARMAHAAEAYLVPGSEGVILVGADAPVLGPPHLAQALEWLRGGADAVLGPAEDGGYVLLGMRRMEGALFQGVPWGTAEVASVTRGRLAALGWRWRELPTLWDVDRPADLARLSGLANAV